MRKITDWPYDGEIGSMDYNFKNKINSWTETTEETYWEQLGCVPPLKQTGYGFVVGEQYGGGCYACFIHIPQHDRYFGRIMLPSHFDMWENREQIRYQFNIDNRKTNYDNRIKELSNRR